CAEATCLWLDTSRPWLRDRARRDFRPHADQFHRHQSARRPQERPALNRAPFLLHRRFLRVTNKTCSRVRRSVFSQASRHSSGRSRLLAGPVAFSFANCSRFQRSSLTSRLLFLAEFLETWIAPERIEH